MRQVLYSLLILLAFLSDVYAAPSRLPDAKATSGEARILIVQFADTMQSGSKLLDAIADAKRDFPTLSSATLSDARALAPMLQDIEGDDIGMIILIAPSNPEIIKTLPALYPDIYFTIIDMQEPLYAANVQSVNFKEEAGAYLLGTIASMRSNTRISIMGLSEDERSRILARHFIAGVKHSEPVTDIDRQTQLKPTAANPTRVAMALEKTFLAGTDVIFALDDEVAELALRLAKVERKMVITADHPPLGADTSRLLTYMVKRYDLALMDVLSIYRHKQWRAGNISLGLTGGYVDYSLNAENVELFPKESIDQIEMIKDQLAQGRL